MSVRIDFLLSATGQKDSLLSGGDGKAKQSMRVPPDHPSFRDAVSLAEISKEGDVFLSLDYFRIDCLPSEAPLWDKIPSVEELLNDLKFRRDRRAVEKETEARKVIEEAEAVLRERKTRMDYLYIGGCCVRFEFPVPDWNCGAPKDIKESPEALAWEQELKEAKDRKFVASWPGGCCICGVTGCGSTSM